MEKQLFSETPAAVGINGHWSDRYTRAEVFENASQFLGPEQNRPGAAYNARQEPQCLWLRERG